MICSRTKRNGEPCTLPAQGGSGLCWAHDPRNAEVRRKGASRGGRSKPGSDLQQLKSKLITLGDDVLAGKVLRADAAVAAQCYGTAGKIIEALVKLRELEESRLVETQLKVREQEQLVERLEQLESVLG
jgi:hypothetical protein